MYPTLKERFHSDVTRSVAKYGPHPHQITKEEKVFGIELDRWPAMFTTDYFYEIFKRIAKCRGIELTFTRQATDQKLCCIMFRNE